MELILTLRKIGLSLDEIREYVTTPSDESFSQMMIKKKKLITCFQFAQLELILTLRKIGLSLDEIREYVTTPSDESFSQMMIKKKKLIDESINQLLSVQSFLEQKAERLKIGMQSKHGKIERCTLPEDESFSQIMIKKKKLIDESINQLLSVQSFLEQKAERLKIGMQSKHGKIERCTLPERKLVLSAPISGDYDEEDFSVAAEFSLRLKTLFHLYDNFGSRISMEQIEKNCFHRYDSFFAYCPHGSKTYDVVLPAGSYLRAYCIGRWEQLPAIYQSILSYARAHQLTLTPHGSKTYDVVLPAGSYLRAYCIGRWEQLPAIYQSILSYARAHQLTLTGYAYEEGLNEMSIKDKNDYITMITVKCD